MIIINFLFTFMLYAHVSASLCIILSFRNKFCHLFRVISHTNTHRRRPLSNKSSSQFITSAHHYPHYEIKFKINGMYKSIEKYFPFRLQQTIQFIPKQRLVASANYIIERESGSTYTFLRAF